VAGFLYYRAGDQRPVTKEVAAKLGLAYAFPAGIQNCQVNHNSPSKSQGNIFADPSRHEGKRVGFFPDQQTWRKLPNVEGRGEIWVGYWNDAKPGPGDLIQSKVVRGIDCILADGRKWHIPVVRVFDGPQEKWVSELPSAWVDDGQGNLVRGTEPTAKHIRLWELTAPIADAMFSVAAGEGGEWPDDVTVGKAVVALLQTNYAVGASELDFLEVVGTEEAFAIICTATRYDVLSDWMDQKKRNCDQSTESGVSLSDGAAA
jgi:hypothetical protein